MSVDSKQPLLLPGCRVKHRVTHKIGVILEVSKSNYGKVAFHDGDVFLPISDLELISETGNFELDLLVKSEFATAEEHSLFVDACVLQHAFQYDEHAGLSNSRIEPKLHQIFVMLRVLNKSQARMILADEVGLGKTIEAGLIIKELRARKLADRILIICPASLVEQWRHELSSKFNEHFEIFDSTALKYLSKNRRDPWKETDSIICSLPFAVRKGEAITDSGPWDLVIVDEAHKVSRRRQGQSWEKKMSFDLVDDLTDKTSGLLLLTATPMQLDVSQLYSLVNLVEPNLLGTLSSFEAMVKELPKLNDLMKAILDCAQRSDKERFDIIDAHSGILGRLGLDISELVKSSSESVGRELLLTKLADKHPLADMMVRNRKREVLDGYQPRVPTTFLIEPTAIELELYEDISEYIRENYDKAIQNKQRAVGFLMVAFQKMLTSSSAAICASFEKRVLKLKDFLEHNNAEKSLLKSATPDEIEEWRDIEEINLVLDNEGLFGRMSINLDQDPVPDLINNEILLLHNFISRLKNTRDSKIDKLLDALKNLYSENKDEKVIIFTQFIETQHFMVDELRKAGYDVEYFNGSMNIDAKERAVSKFRKQSQILVSSEAGGEGRNFQFCHIIVNYDLPWNPMRVEQRIGRIDRIGQSKPVMIYNLAVAKTLEERVLDVLNNRIKLFEESIGSLDPILGNFENEFAKIAMMPPKGFNEAFIEFEDAVKTKRREVLAKEEAFTDLALDRNSFRRDDANKWLQKKPLADWSNLKEFVDDLLKYYGGRMVNDASGHILITPSHALIKDLGISENRFVGEFDPARAMSDEPVDFFATGHYLINSIIDLALKNRSAKVGAVLDPDLNEMVLEIIYEFFSSSGKPNGKLVKHIISKDLRVKSFAVSSFPSHRKPGRQIKSPDWISDAFNASNFYLQESDLVIFGKESTESLDLFKKREIEREMRIYSHVSKKISDECERLETQINDVNSHGTDKQKKIIPALRGKLDKKISVQTTNNISHEEKIAGLNDLISDHNARIVYITLVTPQ